MPLAFPKFNHQRLPLQIVPVHQQHGVLGRLNICNKRAERAQVTWQALAQTHVVLTQTFLAHRPSACTVTQCGTGILRPERRAEYKHVTNCIPSALVNPFPVHGKDYGMTGRRGSELPSFSLENRLDASPVSCGKTWYLRGSGKRQQLTREGDESLTPHPAAQEAELDRWAVLLLEPSKQGH